MHRHVLLTAIGLLVTTFGHVLASEAQPAPRQRPKPVEGYDSPQTAFEAYRSAKSNGDWRSVYGSVTPLLQESMIRESLFTCAMHHQGDARVDALLKRHGVDLDKAAADYYRRKSGADPPAVPAFEATGAKTGALVALPEQAAAKPRFTAADSAASLTELARQVSDKPSFFAEVQAILKQRSKDRTSSTPVIPPTKTGNLEELRVEGDMARGVYTSTSYCLERPAGASESRIRSTSVRRECLFTRINGRWFVGHNQAPGAVPRSAEVTRQGSLPPR